MWQHAAHTTGQLNSPSCYTGIIQRKMLEEFSGKSAGEWTSRQKKKTERVIGLGRRTREEIVKRNQMTALGFQTGGDIRHPRPPFGGTKENGQAFTTQTVILLQQTRFYKELYQEDPTLQNTSDTYTSDCLGQNCTAPTCNS